MIIVTWIIIGLIPGFMAGALAAHNRQTVRVRSGNSELLSAFSALPHQYKRHYYNKSEIMKEERSEYLRW
jgi:hypothetical protein